MSVDFSIWLVGLLQNIPEDKDLIDSPIDHVLGVYSEMSNSFTSSYSFCSGDSMVSLLSTSSKCSLYLANLASLFFGSSPSLLFTAAVCLLLFPVSCFTMLHSSFCRARSAFSAINLILSSLKLFLTALSFSRWSSTNLVFTLSDLVLSIFTLMFFLSPISYQGLVT